MKESNNLVIIDYCATRMDDFDANDVFQNWRSIEGVSIDREVYKMFLLSLSNLQKMKRKSHTSLNGKNMFILLKT